MESAIANEEAIGESRGARKAPTENRNLTAGGHELPRDWLVRIVLIWSGYAVSMFAGNAASYAGIWYVTEATGSPSTLAFLYVLAFLPMGLLSPFGGVVADKHNRKAIIIICDAILSASGIAIAAAFVVGAGAFASCLIPSDGYWLFVACVGVLAIACAWFNAPLMTLLQKGIPEDKLGRVMGLFTAMNGLAIPIGTALGGAIAEVTGTPMFFSVDGVFILALGTGIALSKSVRQLD